MRAYGLKGKYNIGNNEIGLIKLLQLMKLRFILKIINHPENLFLLKCFYFK